ncbi:MAG: GPR1/FUN34/yaaH family-domain-containing protein [Benjaminiella poitrasii]|nr:MAG: GPR1/FUN34/yaaH family-domain-containing protein [Benjaminiella poitrasii]
MSFNETTDKLDISYHESISPGQIESQQEEEQKKSLFPLPVTSELAEFQKTMIGPAIGFAGFGLGSFVLGIMNTGLLTDLPYVAIGVAFSYGALAQYTASIIEICHRNVFSATSFFTFASFFLAFGIMFVPGSGFVSAAGAIPGQLEKCMGLIEISYAICALIFFLGTLRQPILVRMVLGFTFFSYLFSAAGSFSGVVVLTKIGGWVSFVLALTAWYTLMAMLYNETNTFIKIPFF